MSRPASLDVPLAVRWDGEAGCGAPALTCGPGIVGLRGQPDRETARRRIRALLVAALARQCGIDAGRIALHSPPGAAPWAVAALDAGPRRIGLAISHEGGLSVAAYSLVGALGIDVTSVVPVPDWEAVARDFLGPGTADALAALPRGARDAAFAHAWSAHEARLKCLGLQLVEWSAGLARALDACRAFPLELPDGYAGYLALPHAGTG